MCQAVHEENSSSVALVPGAKTPAEPAARLAECPAESMGYLKRPEPPSIPTAFPGWCRARQPYGKAKRGLCDARELVEWLSR